MSDKEKRVEKFDIENETDEKKKQEKYNEYVKQVTPSRNLLLSMLKAFLVGGAICLIGQILTNLLLSQGMETKEAASWTSLLLILGSVILTGFNIYPSFAQFGGAGALVPITGFANGVASSAIESKADESDIIGLSQKDLIDKGRVWRFSLT